MIYIKVMLATEWRRGRVEQVGRRMGGKAMGAQNA